MGNIEDQETEILEKVVLEKNFEELTDDQKIELENKLIWRFLRKYYNGIYKSLFFEEDSFCYDVWFEDRLWFSDENIPKKYAKEMKHFLEVRKKLRGASIEVDSSGQVQFDVKSILDIEGNKPLDSLRGKDLTPNFAEVFPDTKS